MLESVHVSSSLREYLPDLFRSTGSIEGIIDAIERCLPRVISELDLTPPLTEDRRRTLEFGLQGRRGFRRLTGKRKQSAVRELEAASLYRALRSFQLSERCRRQAATDWHWAEQDVPGEFPHIVSRTDPEYSSEPTFWYSDEVSGYCLESLNPSTEGDVDSQIPTTHSEASVAMPEEEAIGIPSTPIELQEPVEDRDVRGLVAVLRAGKLVAFFDPIARDLVPGRGIEKIDVPKSHIYGRLEVDRLLHEYHRLSVDEIDEKSSQAQELRLLNALLVALENEAQWARINRRRFHLINKKHGEGLSTDEADELEQLQALSQKKMKATLPLPFAELAMLENYARGLGLDLDSQGT